MHKWDLIEAMAPRSSRMHNDTAYKTVYMRSLRAGLLCTGWLFDCASILHRVYDLIRKCCATETGEDIKKGLLSKWIEYMLQSREWGLWMSKWLVSLWWKSSAGGEVRKRIRKDAASPGVCVALPWNSKIHIELGYRATRMTDRDDVYSLRNYTEDNTSVCE